MCVEKGYEEENLPAGFIPDDVIPPLLHQGQWPLKAIAFDLSGGCNLACRYCAEAASQPKRNPMSEKVLDAALDMLFPGGRMGEHISLRFGSGEPLLAFSLLKMVDKRMEKMRGGNGSQRPEFFLTTNGTLINEEVAKWLISSSWHVKISFDGPKSIHDAWRVFPDNSGSYDVIKPVIKRLVRRIGKRFSVTAVLCKGTNPKEVFNNIASMGVNRIELVPVVHHNISWLPDSSDLESYRMFLQDYVNCFLREEGKGKTPILTRFAEKVRRVMGYGNTRIPCGSGRSFYGIGPEGTVYPCFRFVGLDGYALGDVFSGIDEKLVSAFRSGPGRGYEERIPCKKCWVAPLCGGPCFSCAELFGPGEGRPLAVHCAYVRADAVAAVRLVNELKKNNPQRLLSFLPEIEAIL
ncbi:MAG: radical SAM protein [Deltaproteobacteria bacterium]